MALAVPAKEPSTPSGMEIARVMAPSVSTESVAMVITTVVLQMGEILSAPALVDGLRHAELVHDGEGGMTGYLVWLPADRQVTGANAPRAKNGPRTNVNQQLSGSALFSVSLAGAPFLAQREAVSPSMTVAATASRRPCSAHSSALGRRPDPELPQRFTS